MKTIKQIADELGVSKPRVDRFFKSNRIKPHCVAGQAMQYDEAAESLAVAHFNKIDTAPRSGSQTTSAMRNTALLDAVLMQLETKDKIIERLQAENALLLAELLTVRKSWLPRLPWGKKG